MAERITPRNEDFAQWYTDIINHAKLADYSPVRGCMVLRPNGYAIWEVMQSWLDRRFKETGHKNAYFPMFIPMSFLQKEKDHVEGFAPQLAVVTHGGGKELEEPLVVRPTSETIINAMYSKWISSYRDLPVLINQWANVVRWELRTKPFLRTLEFLWQEGHTCHATADEAMAETKQMLGIYQEFLEECFAIPVVPGQKTESEKFAGAETTLCLETMMQDKKALQATTSHYFGQKFAKVFDIKFQDKDGQQKFVYQTSWGATTRLVGALIMVHSDDQGLVLPPKAAPTQIAIVGILQKNKDNSAVLEAGNKLLKDLRKAGYRVEFDDRDGQSAGYKFHEWEVQGVPLRIEVGPRDLAENIVVFARRDGVKTRVKVDDVVGLIDGTFAEFQKALFEKATAFLKANTHDEDDYGNFQKRLESEGGFFRMHWCVSAECEAKVKEETKATIRCIPFDQKKESGKCIVCGKPSEGRVIFARNY